MPQTAIAAMLLLLAVGCGGTGGESGGSQPPPTEKITLGSQFFAIYSQGSPLNNVYAIAGQAGFTLEGAGTGFTSSDVLEWNGNPLPTSVSDSADIYGTVSAFQISQPGTITIQVKDTATGVVSNTEPFGIASSATLTAGVAQIITVAPDGSSANGTTLVPPAISATGRFVTFQSNATNLAPGPVSGYQEIYERDTCLGATSGCTPSTIRITVTADGSAVNDHSRTSAVSADGRYVAFDSQATNILAGNSVCSPNSCVFLRDTCISAPSGCMPSTTLISVAMDGSAAGNSQLFSMTPDGRYVTFGANWPNMVVGEPGGVYQLYLRDTCNGGPSGCSPQTTAVSLSSSGTFGDETSYDGSVSSMGRFVAFLSGADNLTSAGNPSGGYHVFLRDLCTNVVGCSNATAQVDLGPGGDQPNNPADNGAPPRISADGSVAAFASHATDLVFQNVNGIGNVYAQITCANGSAGCAPSMTLISLGNDGSVANAGSNNVSISANGRFIAFGSLASNLVPGDSFGPNAWKDIFVRDTCYGAPAGCMLSTVRVSVAIASGIGTSSNQPNDYPAISADGHYLVFMSAATNYLPGAGNGNTMVYLAKTGF